MATLVMLKGPNPGHPFDLARDKVVIGRNPDCDIVVTGGAVSREHTQVFRQNNQFFVKDLGHLIGRREAFPNFPTDRLFAHVFADLARDLEMHVGVEQASADFLQALVDLRLGESAGAAELLKGCCQSVGQSIEHAIGIIRFRRVNEA